MKPTKARFLTSTFLLLFSFSFSYAQMTQTVRGTISDIIVQSPIAGVTVTFNKQSVVTDAEGNFRFTNVPAGTYSLQLSHTGYNDVQLDNITVIAGKESVLTLTMDAKVKTEDELVLKANSKKNRPLNDMSVVSARAFTVEETQKYAAAVNDPSRMATAFPGVMTAEDGGNEIVIRGNAPSGLIWRMEGIDIPNPNHFSSAGSSGGGISILSTQLLANSDFITGAFAAEYGNGLSGVFDLKLRKGNNEKREYTIQAGVLGLNVAAEGPFSKSYKGSYLVNYRYSTLQLLNKMGVEVGPGVLNFHDLSYNIYLPTKRFGTFTFFGFNGFSEQTQKPEKDSTKWEEDGDRYSGKYVANTMMNGITHSITMGAKTNMRTVLGYSSAVNRYQAQFVEDNASVTMPYKDNYKTDRWTLSSTVNHKFSNRDALRAGIILSRINFDYYQLGKENRYAPIREVINTDGNTETIQGFAQWQHKFSNKLSVNGGLHYMRLLYNNTQSIEPRAAVKWDIDGHNSVGFGYGLHSQLQAYGVYFAETVDANGQTVLPNKDLEFTRSHHFVASYGHAFSRNMRLKIELYYQHLFNVPVSPYDSSTLSTLNVRNEFITDPLVNKGKGKNYGAELSLERYLADAFYYTISTSLYQAKYTAIDGRERSTRFNGGYLTSVIAGKEFARPGRNRIVGVNLRVMYGGGYRSTPLDFVRSADAGYAIYKEKEAFTIQSPAYFRTDLRVSMKWSRRHRTNTLSLDLQNVSNRKNVYDQGYDEWTNSIKTYYQQGLIPVLNYKLEF